MRSHLHHRFDALYPHLPNGRYTDQESLGLEHILALILFSFARKGFSCGVKWRNVAYPGV